jgi:hypothetical protein
MKKTAFLQALLIVILLLASWVVFIRRQAMDEPQPAPAPAVAVEETPAEVAPDMEAPVEPVVEEAQPETLIRNMAAVPPQWQDWMRYFQEQATDAARIEALRALREAIFSMSTEDATARLIELIISGADFDTGMDFRVGEGGKLAGGPSLQALLLDWLGQMDAARAAELAQLALRGAGTRLPPELYVMHLRNYGWGNPGEAGAPFLMEHFQQLLEHEPWISSPTGAIAESMDIAVYLENPDLVQPLAGLMAEGKPDVLRHASSLALERMVDQDAVAAVTLLTGTPEGRSMPAETRAGFIARLDPVTPEGRDLLQGYLASAEVSRGEATLFLKHFPNLNRSLSHNLLSHNIPITEGPGHMERLQRALEEVQAWQADPEITGLADQLEATEARINAQLTGSPAP